MINIANSLITLIRIPIICSYSAVYRKVELLYLDASFPMLTFEPRQAWEAGGTPLSLGAFDTCDPLETLWNAGKIERHTWREREKYIERGRNTRREKDRRRGIHRNRVKE